ncbi:MAG: hypothetical protein ACHQJ6_01710 [Candidatus Berkiellales bacterium]
MKFSPEKLHPIALFLRYQEDKAAYQKLNDMLFPHLKQKYPLEYENEPRVFYVKEYSIYKDFAAEYHLTIEDALHALRGNVAWIQKKTKRDQKILFAVMLSNNQNLGALKTRRRLKLSESELISVIKNAFKLAIQRGDLKLFDMFFTEPFILEYNAISEDEAKHHLADNFIERVKIGHFDTAIFYYNKLKSFCYPDPDDFIEDLVLGLAAEYLEANNVDVVNFLRTLTNNDGHPHIYVTTTDEPELLTSPSSPPLLPHYMLAQQKKIVASTPTPTLQVNDSFRSSTSPQPGQAYTVRT